MPATSDARSTVDTGARDGGVEVGGQPADVEGADVSDAGASDAGASDTGPSDAASGCAPGTSLCGATVCVDLVADPMHCGDCANVCRAPVAHGAATCAMGLCGVACEPGFAVCDSGAGPGCWNLSTDPNHCGACDTRCPAVEHGAPACAAGGCGAACDTGFGLSAGRCVALAPPRLLSPLSGARVTSHRPRLRWSLDAPLGSAQVEICRDRACATVVATLTVDGVQTTPETALDAGRYFWRARGRYNSVVATAASATWEFTVGRGDATVNASWGALFDPNGDGCDDVLVGVSDAGDANSVSVFEGARAGLATAPVITLTGTSGAEFAHSIASAGDVNGDGFVDAIVGSPAGAAAVVYLGSPTGLGATPATRLTGPMGSRFGNGVAGAGDVNGDGYADVLVGAPDAGNARVCLGSATGIQAAACTTLAAPVGALGFGYNLGALGDVNGDGFGDIGIGTFSPTAAMAANAAFIYFGSATGLPATPTVTLRGPAESNFGKVVTGGDFNGDGYSDIAISSFSEAENAVYLYSGGAMGVSATAVPVVLRSPHSNDDFGDALADAGDLNADGFTDLAVGAPTSDTVYVYGGRAEGAPSVLATLTYARPDAPPKMSGSSFGRSVAGAGTLTCDGAMTLVVGAPDAHRAMLYASAAGSLGAMPFRTLSGAGGFGFSVALRPRSPTLPRWGRRPLLACMARDVARRRQALSAAQPPSIGSSTRSTSRR